MPLPVPSLDDRLFDDLTAEVRALIPRNFPAWTDHNLSDPGITLLELFAFLAEAAFYQLDQIPERTLERFGELAGATRLPGEPVGAFLRRAVEAMAAINRAITPADTELVVASGVFAVDPPLSAQLAAATPAAMLAPLPGPVTLAGSAAGDVALSIAVAPVLRAGDLIRLDDRGAAADLTELATVVTVAVSASSAAVTLSAPLRYGHAAGIALTRMAEPAPASQATLARDAPAGASVVVLEPAAQLRGSGVLRIGTGVGALYVLATGIARAEVIAQVIAAANVFPADQVVKVLLVPGADGPAPVTPPAVTQAVFELLRDRSPITSRIQVVDPRYVPVRVDATVVRDFASLLRKDVVQQNAQAAIQTFLSPLRGGDDGTGWPFGRSVYRSELYQVLQDTTGVDHVQALLIGGDPTVSELPLAADAATASVSLVQLTGVTVTVVDA